MSLQFLLLVKVCPLTRIHDVLAYSMSTREDTHDLAEKSDMSLFYQVTREPNYFAAH